MANPTPLPTYYGDTGVKQDEFIDSLRQYHRTQQRAQRMGHFDWDTVLTAGQFLKGEAHREWQQFIRDHGGLPIIETNKDLWREYFVNVAYYNIQGRMDGKPRPLKPT